VNGYEPLARTVRGEIGPSTGFTHKITVVPVDSKQPGLVLPWRVVLTNHQSEAPILAIESADVVAAIVLVRAFLPQGVRADLRLADPEVAELAKARVLAF